MFPSFLILLFLIGTLGLFLLPGGIFFWCFSRLWKDTLPFERLLYAFALSMGILDFLMILLGTANIPLTPMTLITVLSGFLVATGGIAVLRKMTARRNQYPTPSAVPRKTMFFDFSHRQGWLFVVLLALTVFVKTLYLIDASLPTATDLGHHMYWSKLIAETGKLPFYAKQDIVTDAKGNFTLTDPEPIADFIIGEHLPFAAVNIVFGMDFFSAFPVALLLLINLLSLLALVMLSFRLASGMRSIRLSANVFTPQNVAIATLFFFGPLYTLASPQAKFVSGGVVGNTIGNFFIPLILLVFYRALKEKRSDFLAIALFLTFTLAYTHHLSTFVLLFVLFASAATFLIFHWKNAASYLRLWIKLFCAPAPILVALFAFLFFFAVALPTYIETNAIGTAVGTPIKATRTGLTFLQAASSSGEVRMALGLAGILLLLALRSLRKTYAAAFLLGWSLILLVMTFRPDLLFIDIPSNRIGSYLSFPLGMLAAFTLVAFFASLKTRDHVTLRLPALLTFSVAFLLLAFSLGGGSVDNGESLLPKSKARDMLQTFAASRYLADHTQDQDIILKDHNYIVADSWIKLFFLKGYNYPLSRGFFKRYEDNPNREQCTLRMISVPNTPQGEKCYEDTGTDLIMVNPYYDATQFEKSEKFSRLYVSEGVHIYKRKE